MIVDNTILFKKITSLPADLKKQVEDFVDALSKKHTTASQKKGPKFGSAKGMFVMHPSFDEPLDDFKEYMQ